MMSRDKWRAILELGRVSNIPTTVSNVTAGFLLGGGSLVQSLGTWLITVLAIVCLYEAGMFLNDICDYSIDCLERPHRPIPSGRVSKKEAILMTIGLFVIGILIIILFCPKATFLALSLTGLILLYNWVHVRFLYSPILMGGCRGSIYLIAAVAGGWKAPFEWIWIMAGVLMLYISAVSFIARYELKDSLSWIHPLFFIVAVGTVFLPMMLTHELVHETHFVLIIAFLIALSWLLQTGLQLIQKKIYPMAAVGRMLSGISLLDALILAKVNAFFGVGIAWICFIGARLWQKRIQST